MPYRLLLACAIIALPTPLLAQSSTTQPTAQAAAAAPATGMNAQAFVEKVAISNMFEVESSELALDKAETPEVRQFAEEMVQDHQAATEKLETTIEAAQADVDLPDEMDAEHQGMIEQLEAAEGAEFERLYVEMQVKAHEKAVSLFQTYAENGDNQTLQEFANETLPTLKDHHHEIQNMKTGS